MLSYPTLTVFTERRRSRSRSKERRKDGKYPNWIVLIKICSLDTRAKLFSQKVGNVIVILKIKKGNGSLNKG